MTEQQEYVLNALKRCHTFLLRHGRRLGGIEQSPQARELASIIENIEYCEFCELTGAFQGWTTLSAGADKAMAFAIRNARKVRGSLDLLVRPLVRDRETLRDSWDLAKIIDPNAVRIQEIARKLGLRGRR